MHVAVGSLLLCLFMAGVVTTYEGWDRSNTILYFIGIVLSGISGLALIFH